MWHSMRTAEGRSLDCDVEFEDEAFLAALDKLEEDAIAQRQ